MPTSGYVGVHEKDTGPHRTQDQARQGLGRRPYTNTKNGCETDLRAPAPRKQVRLTW